MHSANKLARNLCRFLGVKFIPINVFSIIRLVKRPTLLWTALVITALLSPAVQAAEAPRSLPEIWRNGSLLMFKESQRDFENLKENSNIDPRETGTGAAVMLLNRQPKTDENAMLAYAMLDEVIAGGADDDLGLMARYYQARVRQYHQQDPDIEEADRIYQELYRQYPETFWGQLAFTKHAALLIMGETDNDAAIAAIDEIEAQQDILTDPAIQSAHFDMMARAKLFFVEDNDAALDYYTKAWKAGVPSIDRLKDTLISIGTLAEETGDDALAIEVYQAFVDRFIRDKRYYSIKKRLERLTADEPAERKGRS